jgi:hypothetical protein
MFSQLHAKSSIPDICAILIQANNAGEDQRIYFHYNDMLVKIGRELNARRNTRFMGRSNKTEQNNDVG